MTSRRSNAPPGRAAHLVTLGSSLPILERAYRAAANQAVSHVGVSQALAWPLLMIGRHGDGMRQGQLAGLLNIEGPSLARSVEQLAQGGLIERRDDPADRRAKTLHLTPAGSEACRHIETALHGLRDTLFAGVPDADILACLRVFATLRDRLGCPPVPAAAPPADDR